MVSDVINVIKDHWQVLIGLFLVAQIILMIIKFIFKKVFGVVAKPLSILKKVSLFDWILIGLLAGSMATIIYLTM